MVSFPAVGLPKMLASTLLLARFLFFSQPNVKIGYRSDKYVIFTLSDFLV